MSREKAFELLKQNIQNQNLIKHCLAVEAIMIALAQHFGEGEEDKSFSSPTELLRSKSEGKEENEVLFAFAVAREDKERWGLTGLLHDIDYEKTKDDASQHSLVGAQLLESLGLDKEICQAVKVHNEAHGIEPETMLEKALFVTDPLTGLIVAAALVLPSKKLVDLTPENVLNRFKEKAFARGANRDIIKKCEGYLNLNLEEFVKIGIGAMQGIAKELGL